MRRESLLLVAIVHTCFLFVLIWSLFSCEQMVSTKAQIPETTTPRRTVILVGDDVLHELTMQNLTSVNGVVTVQVDTLESPVSVDTAYLRDNAGRLEFYDNASTWQPVGIDGYTNASSFDIGPDLDGTLALKFGGTEAIYWNTSTLELKWWDGIQWRDFGSGSGQGFALTVDDHTNTALENTKSGQYAQLDSTTLQLSFLANFTDLATAENFLHRIETGYSCTEMRFGKNASDQLVYEHFTNHTSTCDSTTYTTTATLSSVQQGRWVEYAVQVDEAGNIVFYVDGEVFESQAMTSAMDAQATDNEILRLYEGFRGGMGPVKIGTLITWPGSGWKGIDLEMQTFPGVVFGLPLSEYGQSTVTDVIGSEPLSKDGDVSWTSVSGGF